MPLEHAAYLLFALSLGMVLLSRSQNRGFAGLMLFWLLGYPLLSRPEYTLSVPTLSIDMQPNRLILLVLAPLLLFAWLRDPRARRSIYPAQKCAGAAPVFQRFLWFYVIILGFMMVVHASEAGASATVAAISSELAFLVMFIGAKRYGNKRDLELIITAVVALAVVVGIISVVQFWFNPAFMRLGPNRLAFANYVRPYGLFASEFELGFFEIAALLLATSRLRNKAALIVMWISCTTSVFLTMHRLSWAVFILIIGLSVIVQARRNKRVLGLVVWNGLVLVLMGMLVSSYNLVPVATRDAFLSERLFESGNVVGRVEQYTFALRAMKAYPLGLGGYTSDLYLDVARAMKAPVWYQPDLGEVATGWVHNGFLAAGAKWGIAAMLAFTAFVLSTVAHFVRRWLQGDSASQLPALLAGAFLLYNTTNDFSSLGTQLTVFYAMLIGYFSAIEGFMTELPDGLATRRSSSVSLGPGATPMVTSASKAR